jgi:Mg-chelatase subunit ChlI
MSDGQVSIEGTTHILAKPFFVMATQNPFEFEGTYILPESQLDRFMLLIDLGYPPLEVERALASLSSRPEAAASAVVEAFEAKDAALRAELQRAEEAERAAAVPGRIARGELVVARYVEVCGGVNPVLREVDVATDAKVIREMGVGCVEHEGALYVEAKNAHTCRAPGTRVVGK